MHWQTQSTLFGGLFFRYFYGNGVFRSTFVSILLGSNAGIMTNWLWSFLNAGIQVLHLHHLSSTLTLSPSALHTVIRHSMRP